MASGPRGIVATTMIWHQAASHVTANLTVDCMDPAVNVTEADQ